MREERWWRKQRRADIAILNRWIVLINLRGERETKRRGNVLGKTAEQSEATLPAMENGIAYKVVLNELDCQGLQRWVSRAGTRRQEAARATSTVWSVNHGCHAAGRTASY